MDNHLILSWGYTLLRIDSQGVARVAGEQESGFEGM
jgi:hypothetical protein